jgi:Spy/CpxP family protein refolding chaperone
MFNQNSRKMKSRLKKGLLALFVSAMMLVSVSAQPPAGRGYGPGQGWSQGPGQGWNQGNRPGAGIENIISDLTEDQKAALQQLRTEHYAKMKDHRNQMGELAAKQRTIMSDYNIDQKAAQKLIDQKTELINKQMKERVAHKAAVNKLLTEDQVLQLERCTGNRQFAQKKGRHGQQRGGYYAQGPNHRRGYCRNF